MSVKKIYIIRHGQTDFNLQGIVQGSGVNSSLNATGKAQAKAFFEKYKGIPFDKVYISVLKRTRETVDGFIQMGIAHEAHSGLNEISWGSNEGKKITPDEDAYYHWMLKQWQEGNTSLRIEGGESPDEVAVRQQPIIQKLIENTDEKNVLVCMHGRAMRILICQLLQYPLKSMDMFEHKNLCLYEVDFTGSLFSINKYNDTTHLRNLVVTEEKIEETAKP